MCICLNPRVLHALTYEAVLIPQLGIQDCLPVQPLVSQLGAVKSKPSSLISTAIPSFLCLDLQSSLFAAISQSPTCCIYHMHATRPHTPIIKSQLTIVLVLPVMSSQNRAASLPEEERKNSSVLQTKAVI